MSHLESFIVQPDHIDGHELSITGSEFHHLHKVKRKRPGDVVAVTDGQGNFYQVKLKRFGRSDAHCQILKTSRKVGEAATAITVVQGMLKSQRMDWLIEKGTELGVMRFVPVKTAFSGSDLSQIKKRRWERLAREAVKQCGRSVFPQIDPLQDLEDLMEKLKRPVWFAHPRESGRVTPEPKARNPVPGNAITLLVGPEGGFSDDEVQDFTSAGFTQVTLGQRRLRAETAGLAMITLALQERGEL